MKAVFRRYVEWLGLSTTVMVVWSLLTLPVIFYYLPATGNSSQAEAYHRCNPHQYREGICFASLQEMIKSQNCSSDDNIIFMAEYGEDIASTIMYYFSQLDPSEECSENMLAFVCLYTFGLCNDYGELVQPTVDQCESIQYGVCAKEWKLATAYEIGVPDCELLPAEQNILCVSPWKDINESLHCQKNFFYDVDLQFCTASCQTWSQYGEVTTTAVKISVITSNCVGILLAILVLVFSIIRYKSMLQFPSILLVYATTDLLVKNFIIVIGCANADLFCTSSSIDNTTMTPFCAISGMVHQYTTIQLQLWWMFHLGVVFWGVWFPFHYRKYKDKKRMKYVSVTISLISISLPIIPIVALIADYYKSIKGSQTQPYLSGGLGFVSYPFPPILCTPATTKNAFYAFVLPIDLILAVGGTLKILIIYGFYKNKQLVGTTEKKAMLILCYYTIVIIFDISNFSAIMRNNDAFRKALQDYFTCESYGIDPDSPCRRLFEEYSYPVILVLDVALLALYPLYVLIYVIDTQQLKKKLCHCFSKVASTTTS